MRWLTSGLAFLLLIGGLPFAMPLGPAAASEPEPIALPSPRAFTSAVWTGTEAFIFGGSGPSGLLDEIVRFDPATGEMAVTGSRLPTPRDGTAAFWDGQHAYVLAGRSPTRPWLDEVVRFDPSTGEVVVLDVRLPDARRFPSVAWTGEAAYVFAGTSEQGEDTARRTIRFDPHAGSAVLLDARVPKDVSGAWHVWEGTAAFWDGNAAFLSVGYHCSGWCGSGRIYRYDPAADRFDWTAFAPRHGEYPGLAWDGSHAYFIGGVYRVDHTSLVEAYDPSTGHLELTHFRMAHWARGLSAVWDGQHILAFGGYVSGPFSWNTREFYDQVGIFTPRKPGPLSDLHADPGIEAGSVMLRWDQPADLGGFDVAAYRLYHVRPGAETLLAEVDGQASGYVARGLAIARTSTFRASAVNLKGEGPRDAEASSLPQVFTQPGTRAMVTIVDGEPDPPHVAVTNGGLVTFRNLGSIPADPQDTRTHGDCFRLSDDGGRLLFRGDQWSIALLHDRTRNRLDVSFDLTVFYGCPPEAAMLSPRPTGAAVPFHVGLYGTGTEGAIHLVEPPRPEGPR